MRPSKVIFFVLVAVLAASSWAQEEPRWDIMTIKEMGVDRFRAEYPEFDGSGVVVAVMDTGVDMGVEGLTSLPGGGVKVVDVQDFTGEGDLFWEEGRLVPHGDNGEKLVDSKGRELRGFRAAAKDADPQRFYMAFLEESKFSDTSVRDMNGDGDSKDVFGFLIFSVRETAEKAEDGEAKDGEDGDGKAEASGAGEGEAKAMEKPQKKGELLYVAVVDVNGDGNLDDGVRITDYWRKHQSFALKGKEGDRRQLTMGANFHPEEQRLSVHFDDGGHGTHVAGIAAGYRIHGQEGYHGMAPGAKVISLKIGNNHFAGGATVTESVKKALDYGVYYAKKHKVPVVYNMSFSIGSEREGESAIDQYVDQLLWKNPGVVFVNSASNDGPGLSSVGTPAAAKRAITVGALLGPEAAAAQYGCSLDREVAFSFSSRGGDTFKPDIMAPGSASSTVPPWGDRDHMNGTSMSSPAAAGAVALLVDGLARHDPPYKVDNALVLRAVKNTGRHVPGLTTVDEGGGVLDVPAAYAYAKFLYEGDENKGLREYRIANTGPAPGKGVIYWRMSPTVPKKTEVMGFRIESGFADKMTKEDRARFYRAFDLTPDVDWLSLDKPMVYLKGSMGASVGVMADLEGRAPGLYTGKVRATRKSDDRVGGAPVHAFDLVVNVMVPHRMTPENRGMIETAGELLPGGFERVFIEILPGTTAMTFDLRMLEGGGGASVSGSIYDPEGVARSRVGSVSEERSNSASRTLTGRYLVPGTWEIVMGSSMRSRAPARYDLKVTLAGVDLGEPLAFNGNNGSLAKERMLVPMRCTQAVRFNGTVSGRFEGIVRREVVEMEDTDTFTRVFKLDNNFSRAAWTIDFDRETYALFTDCVFRIEDPETDKALRNTGFSYRSSSVGMSIDKNLGSPKAYRLVLMPGFAKKSDTKKWRFILTEKLTWSSGAMNLDPVSPKGGRVNLLPWEWLNLEFRLPAQPPVVPDGYRLSGVLEARTSGPPGVILSKNFEM